MRPKKLVPTDHEIKGPKMRSMIILLANRLVNSFDDSNKVSDQLISLELKTAFVYDLKTKIRGVYFER